MKDIEDILTGDQTENPAEADTEAQPEDQAPSGNGEKEEAASEADKPNEDADLEKPDPEKQPEDTSQPESSDKDNDWTYHAYKDKADKAAKYRDEATEWRDKAKALEQEVAALRQKEAEAQAPDVIENPEGYSAYWRDRHAQFEQRQEQFEHRMRFENSMQLAHAQHGKDFEVAHAEALDRAARGDQSVAFLKQSPNPGQALVQWFKAEQASKRLEEHGGDLDAFEKSIREKVEAEVREKLEAEQAEKVQQQEQERPVMPTGLADARSTGSRTGPKWSGPSPLADILGR